MWQIDITLYGHTEYMNKHTDSYLFNHIVKEKPESIMLNTYESYNSTFEIGTLKIF